MARRAFVAAALAVLLPFGSAEANARLCNQLEAQLAALPAGGGSSAQARRHDKAIQRQQAQMQKAREEGRKAGCGLAMFGRAVAFCGSLAATMQRMESNLAKLQRERAKMGGGDHRRERARIRAAIDVNGCRAQERALPPPIEEAFAPSTRGVIDGRTGLRMDNRDLSGNFRTMCVRTCDGYYFPISWSVSPVAFERDQNVCAAMCPGTEVELYYHRVPEEESDAMVSVSTGLPYTEMANAFRYREADASFPAGCGCEASAAAADRGFTVIGGDHGNGLVVQPLDEQPATAAIPQPSVRPDPAEDPETLASREGGLDIETLKRLATPARRRDAEDGERDVRVVGPTFLPDPEEAIDLRARDPNRAP